jgi:hypothetical protein
VKNGKKIGLFYMGDFVVFLTILILAAVSFFLVSAKPSGGKLTAVVTQNGSELYRIGLEEVTGRIELEIGGTYQELLVAENGRIRFEKADCPDQICVNTGWISRPGQVAVCVPAGVIVKITGDGGKEEEVDIFLK